MGYAHLCGFNHRGVTIAFDSFLRGHLASFYTASNNDDLARFGKAVPSVKRDNATAEIKLCQKVSKCRNFIGFIRNKDLFKI